jgi:hypothetical protein
MFAHAILEGIGAAQRRGSRAGIFSAAETRDCSRYVNRAQAQADLMMIRARAI